MLFKGKKSVGEAVVTAKEYVSLMARGLTLPPAAILCPVVPLAKTAAGKNYLLKNVGGIEIYVFPEEKFCMATGFGCGGPAAAMAVELLAALGVREMILVGLAGSLQEEVLPGDTVVCDGSFCADGTSVCYTSKEIIKPSAPLFERFTRALRASGENFHVGRNWSADAIYRETKAQIKHYQKQQALTVEMETSAFYAACARLRVRGVSAFVVSDSLHKLRWEPDFKNAALGPNLRRLFDCARRTLNAK
ncbi:MAG: hypothetical protein J6V32_06170 [Elusimicrobiaceae bacterium]|nr:hypothetical protein [Elusimicrobiaceae bacterium]